MASDTPHPVGTGDSKTTLPIHGQPPEVAGAEAPGDGPRVYVTLEEKVILEAMRELRTEAESVRVRLAEAATPEARGPLEEQLSELRNRRRELAEHRKAAYRRKMIMLVE